MIQVLSGQTLRDSRRIVPLHGLRRVAELALGEPITEKLPKDAMIGDICLTD
jgi:hypothetical protein